MTVSKHFFRFFLFTCSFALGLAFCLPLSVHADDFDYSDFKGEVQGENGLEVRWRVEAELPGKTKSGGEENAWLVVQPSLGGKELNALTMESEYITLPEFQLVYIEDLNFDNHDDLFLAEGMSTQGAYGAVWLFNPESGQFVPSESFTSMYSVDKKRKRLVDVYRDSACEGGIREYEVRGFDKLELVYEEGRECPEELMDKNQYRAFKRTYINGKLASKEEKILTSETEGE